MIAKFMEPTSGGTGESGNQNNTSKVSDTLNLITELEAQMGRLEAARDNCCEESGSRAAKIMWILQRAVDNAYDTLE